MGNHETINETPNNNNPWEELTQMPPFSESQGEKLKEITCEKLTPEDVAKHPEQIAETLYLIDQYIMPDLFGDAEKAKTFAKEIFSDDPDALFSYNKTFVAKDGEGNIAGIVVYRDEKCSKWDTEAVRARFESTGVELPEHFDRANDVYMKKVTDPELPEGAAEIEFIGVRDEYQGLGIGKQLANQIINNPDYSEVHLDVLDSHEGAQAFYNKLGFRASGNKFGNYPDGTEGVQHMILKKNVENPD